VKANRKPCVFYKEVPAIPVLLKVIIVFGLILTLNRLRLPLSLSLLLGSLALGFWMGLGPFQWTAMALSSVTALRTMSLVLVVGLILVISRLMEETGHLDRLVQSFSRLSRDARVVGTSMSALIGLLPMPGGALFSAPMVETSMATQSVTREEKTILNYWFRHVWEYWWPLYPGVVLAVALLKVDTWRYMLFMAPLSVVSIMAGVVFVLRPIERHEAHQQKRVTWKAVKTFLREMMPISIVVFVIIMVAGLLRVLEFFGLPIQLPGAFSILPGLVASIVYVCRVNRISLGQLRKSFLNRHILPMLFLVLTIMIFQGLLIESRAVIHIRNELVAYGIPLVLIVIVMPFLSGFVTGISIGFVGTSFPLLIPMFPTNPLWDYLSFAALGYAFGFMGTMLSPVHICFLVTKDYYEASLMKSYRQLLLPVLAFLSVVTGLFLLSQAVH
jgi:integral membrane protein (TIGR00529 family)